jgi:ABC-type Fe3+-siderophore transport system permease subunit
MGDVERPRRRSERAMGALRFLTTLYAIMLVVMILIAIGSVIGLFDNPMIDPGV